MQPYRLADLTIKKLNRLALRIVDKTKHKLLTLGFDELNVMNEIDVLYVRLDENNRKLFRELFCERYAEMYLWLTKKKPDEDMLDELVDMYLAGLLTDPNENTHYSYETETLRKRDRTKEAINSVPTKAQKQLELDKALRIWTQMSGWYADFTSQGAEIQALIDAGVERVERHEMDDGKTCSICASADGEKYAIDDIPPLPHLRCRRWFTPI